MIKTKWSGPYSVVLAAGILALSGCAIFSDDQQELMQLRLIDVEARLIRMELLLENEAVRERSGRLDQLERTVSRLADEFELLSLELQLRAAMGGLSARQDSAAIEAVGAGSQSLPMPDSGDQANYDAAFQILASGWYEGAADAFQVFLNTFPNSPLSPNAQYWLAEAAYAQREFEEALGQFQRVVDLYPQSDKAPDALLKMGYAYYELRRFEAARDTLELVRMRYPGTAVAGLAEQRLDRLRNEVF